MSEQDNTKKNTEISEEEIKFQAFIIMQREETIKKYNILTIISGVTWILLIAIGAFISVVRVEDSRLYPVLIVPAIQFVTFHWAFIVRYKNRKELNSLMMKTALKMWVICVSCAIVILGIVKFIESPTYAYRNAPKDEEIVAMIKDLYGVDSEIVDSYPGSESKKVFVGEYKNDGKKWKYKVYFPAYAQKGAPVEINFDEGRIFELVEESEFLINNFRNRDSSFFEYLDLDINETNNKVFVYSVYAITDEAKSASIDSLAKFCELFFEDEVLSYRYDGFFVIVQDEIYGGETVMEIYEDNYREEIEKMRQFY